MQESNPSMKISIVTPTFNSEKTIAANVESILIQRHTDFEHILIDNVSNDRTLEIATNLYEKAEKKEKLIIVSEKDKGISDAFNKGIQQATGQVIAILNSDDLYFDSNIFSDVVEKFNAKPELGFIHADLLFKDERFGTSRRKPLLCPLAYAMPYNHPTMFLRAETYKKIGVFGIQYKYCMDFDLVCRLHRDNVTSEYVPKIYTIMNAGGVSDIHEEQVLKEFIFILKDHNLFSLKARRFIFEKLARIKFKKVLIKSGGARLITLWRSWKWN